MNMAEGIKKSDLIQGDPIDEIRQDLDQLAKSLEQTDTLFKSIASTMKNDISPNLQKTAKGIREINEAEIKSEKLIREKLLNEEKLNKVKIAQERLVQTELRTAAQREASAKREQAAQEKLNKATEKAKQLILDEANAYKKLTSETNKAQAEFKQLAAQHGVNSRQAKAARDKFEQLDNALRKVNNAARDGRRDVGRYGEAWKSAQSTLTRLGVGISVGFIAREGLQTLVEYEDAVAKFRTIVSDLSDTEFSKYNTAITNVAKTTKLSTTEIAQSFETIAGLNASFAKSPKQISQVSEAVATLAKASKGELQPTAESLVGIMNQFDLAANQANRTINVLAAGQAVGASSIDQSAEAYKNFGSVAKGANIDLEKSQALIQTVAKFSIFGAEAGTKLRGATLKLQQANLGYQSGQFNINDALKEYNEQLKKKTSAQEKDALASDVFGAENITVGKILANNIPLIEKFEKGVTGTSEAQKAAEINANTLSNRWGELKDSVSTFLTTNGALNGSLNAMKNGLKFVADNLGTIVSVLGKAVKAFVIFKTVMFALKISDQYKAWKNLGKGIQDATDNMDGAASGAKRFGAALKGIGLTALIALVYELGNAWYSAATKAAFYENVQRAIQDAETKGATKADARVAKREAEFQKEINRINTLKSKREISESEAIELTKKATDARARQVEIDIKGVKQQQAQSLKNLEIAKKNQALFDNATGSSFIRGNSAIGGVGAKTIAQLDAEVAKYRAEVNAANAKISIYRGELDGAAQSTVDLIIADNELQNDFSGGTGSIIDRTEAIEKQKQAYKDLSDEIDNLLDRGQSIEEIEDEEIALLNEAVENGLKQRQMTINDYERLGLINAEDAADQRLIAEIESLLERKKILELYGRDTLEIDLELSQARLNLATENATAEVTIETDKNEEIYNAYKSFQEALTDVLKEQIDARIDALKKEEDAAKSRQDFYEQLAANGNITAKESITEQIELQRQAQEEQARLEATKQRIEAISAGLKTYVALLEDGKTPTQALTGAVTTTEVLASLLKNIPFFATGTNNAPEGWAVVDEKGAEMVTDKKGNIKDMGQTKGARLKYLQAGDKVVTATKTANILNSFDQIEMSKIVRGATDKVGNSYDLMMLNDTMKGMRGDMSKLQTQINVDWQGLAGGMARVNVHTTKGGDKRTERYTVR